MSGPGASTRVYGIVGWPVGHSLSPALHNAAFRAEGMDAVYVAFPVPPGEMGRAMAGLRALGVAGANVTMPHKEEAAGLADEVEDSARRVGAVNTLALQEGRVVGHNTDVEAFRLALVEDAGFDPRGGTAVVLGAGGAARACVAALAEAGVGRLVVAARRAAAAEEVAAVAAGSDVATAPFADAERRSREADLLVNATPLGWKGESVPLHPRKGQVAVDLVYRATPFLERARAAGADAHDGLGMLVRQAALAFTIWTGREAPLPAMRAVAASAQPGH